MIRNSSGYIFPKCHKKLKSAVAIFRFPDQMLRTPNVAESYEN